MNGFIIGNCRGTLSYYYFLYFRYQLFSFDNFFSLLNLIFGFILSVENCKSLRYSSVSIQLFFISGTDLLFLDCSLFYYKIFQNYFSIHPCFLCSCSYCLMHPIISFIVGICITITLLIILFLRLLSKI